MDYVEIDSDLYSTHCKHLAMGRLAICMGVNLGEFSKSHATDKSHRVKLIKVGIPVCFTQRAISM